MRRPCLILADKAVELQVFDPSQAVLQRINKPTSQPFLTGEVAHPFNLLDGPAVDLLQQVDVLSVLGTPELDTALQADEMQCSLPAKGDKWQVITDGVEQAVLWKVNRQVDDSLFATLANGIGCEGVQSVPKKSAKRGVEEKALDELLDHLKP
ncbi:hypothetical protein BTVI_92988 [Pitangus sulphuratus]|nr:hypothetical protein BTVI_92988 [Pitangus sulphuratus]